MGELLAFLLVLVLESFANAFSYATAKGRRLFFILCLLFIITVIIFLKSASKQPNAHLFGKP